MNSNNKYSFLIIFLIAGLLQPGFLFSQKDQKEKEKTKKIEIIHANSLEYNKNINPDVRRFIGDVQFKHNDFNMYCDSAYFHSKDNKLDAFSNVHIVRGDTLHLYGDVLSYNGNTNLGEVRENVKLEDKEAELLTDSLDFNTEENHAHYFEGGKIKNEDKTITSISGDYYSSKKMAHFKDSVIVESPDYTVEADTLNYNTETETAFFLGPTDIYSDSSYLYCEKGWYKTKKNEFLFTKNALYRKGDRILKGDTLYYDEPRGFGQIKQNAEMIDTAKNIILKGHYSEYKENPNSAFLTDSALMVYVDSEKDSLFLHADTLRSHYDSTETYRIFKAYNKVKFFKYNLQGKCDSLQYTLQDSVIQMFDDPVMWSDTNQITSDTIKIFTENNQISKFRLIDKSFMISKEDTGKFNQVKGSEMTGHFRDNNLKRVFVDGNSESVYFTRNDDEQIIGVNKGKSSKLLIKLIENQVSQIRMLEKPSGTLYPIKDIQETNLEGFKWLEIHRPKSKKDIFIWETGGESSEEDISSSPPGKN
ncbi:MAG: OstA-like protein [Bacteroidota bacterium]